MAVTEQKRLELNSITRLIDELDYYQILKVSRDATPEDVKEAYFKESREFHPDKYYTEDAIFRKKVTIVFKRINEGYKVLSDQKMRDDYTRGLDKPNKRLRYDLGGPANQTNAEDTGATPMVRKYYEMGKQALSNRDYRGAKINFQLAAQMEPNNETFKEKLAEIDKLTKKRR